MVRKSRAEAEQTRAALLDAAERLFYKDGVSRTSLEAVAREAGVTRGAVYWHFADKCAVLSALQDRARLPQDDIVESLAQGTSDRPLDALYDACVDTFNLVASDKQRQRIFAILSFRCEYTGPAAEVGTKVMCHKEEMMERFVRVFEQARKKGQLSANWTAQTAGQTLFLFLGGQFKDWMMHPTYDLPQRATACLKALFNTFRA